MGAGVFSRHRQCVVSHSLHVQGHFICVAIYNCHHLWLGILHCTCVRPQPRGAIVSPVLRHGCLFLPYIAVASGLLPIQYMQSVAVMVAFQYVCILIECNYHCSVLYTVHRWYVCICSWHTRCVNKLLTSVYIYICWITVVHSTGTYTYNVCRWNQCC